MSVEQLEQLLNCPVDKWHLLKEVDLSDNQLTSLPPEVGEWRSCEIIDLDYNQLTSLPPEVGEWRSCETIDLDYNQLTSLPPEVGEWRSCKEIYLNNNQLLWVDDALCDKCYKNYLDKNKYLSLSNKRKIQGRYALKIQRAWREYQLKINAIKIQRWWRDLYYKPNGIGYQRCLDRFRRNVACFPHTNGHRNKIEFNK